ncbi:hypothetical protein HDE_05559 [Halotydeus destructor]|nr:hypothetical protein HDE_05559 [Halotydeus destructor]
MDVSPSSRKGKLGYSKPSNQPRNGPAPLASFEDLPSDDQASPDDSRDNLSPDEDVLDRGLCANARDLLVSSPTKTLTPAMTPTNDRSDDGQSGSVTPTANDISPSTTSNENRTQAWQDVRSATHATIETREVRAGAWNEIRNPSRCPPHTEPDSDRTRAWHELRTSSPVELQKDLDRAKAWNEVRKPKPCPLDIPPDSDRTRAWRDLRASSPVEIPPNLDRARAWNEVRKPRPCPPDMEPETERSRAWHDLRGSSPVEEPPRNPERAKAWEDRRKPRTCPPDKEPDSERSRAWHELRKSSPIMSPPSNPERSAAWEAIRALNASPRAVQSQLDVETFIKNDSRQHAWETLRDFNASPNTMEEQECRAKVVKRGERRSLSTSPLDPERLRAWEEVRKLYHADGQIESPYTNDRKKAWEEVRKANHSPLQEEAPSQPNDAVNGEDRTQAWQDLRKGHLFNEEAKELSVKERSIAWEEIRKVNHSPLTMTMNPEAEARAAAWAQVRKASHGSQLDAKERRESASKSLRKGSWADIFFRGRSRSRSKSPGSIDGQSGKSSCPEQEPARRERKRSSIFSLFSSKKDKTSKSDDIMSPELLSSPTPRETSTPRVSITDTDAVGNVELVLVSETQGPDSLEETVSTANIPLQIAEANNSNIEFNEVLLRRSLKRRDDTTDDEVQSLPEVLPSVKNRSLSTKDATSDDANEATLAESDLQRTDSDSDAADESTLRETVTCAEDDTEAANLLTQDSVDCDESLYNGTGQREALERSAKISQLLNRKERQDVVLASLDRPRSITPASVAPLEEFLRKSSTSPDPSAERIKLSLPGEQFTSSGRSKSPRKSNPQIWLDFCEKGLQTSPRSSRRNKHKNKHKDESNLPFGHQEPSVVPVAISPNDAFTPVTDTPLTPVTPLDDNGDCRDWNMFPDSFDPSKEEIALNLPTECNKCDCRFLKGIGFHNDSNLASPVAAIGPDDPEAECLIRPSRSIVTATRGGPCEDEQPLVSPNACSCDCHKCADIATLWRKASLHKQDSLLSGSSDISSASSRLINSSSSSSVSPKCSPDGQPASVLPV